MQCDQFETEWQQRLDAGEDPRFDEQLVAHSLCCSACNELLEGSKYLLAMPDLLSRATEPPHALPPVAVSNQVTLAPSSMYRTSSARWPSVAAAMVAVIAITLWGRVWMGLAEPQHTVASAQRAVEDSIAGVHSPRNVATSSSGSEVSPWVPSPLQLALRARETRYLLNNTDPLVLNGWRTTLWEHSPNSPQFWAEGLEPLTSSWELAVQVIRSTLPLNWSVSGESDFDFWMSPLEQ